MGMFDQLRRRFFEEYSAYLHPLSTERMVPGALVEVVQWRYSFPFDTAPDFAPSSTYGWTWIDKHESDYEKTSPYRAGIFNGTMKDRFEFDGSLSLPQLGLSINGSISSKYQITVDIKEVTAVSFEKGMRSFVDLREELQNLEESNSTYYKAVKDDFLVSDAFFVSKAILDFESEAGASAEAEFKNAGFEIGGDASAAWSNDGKQLMFEGALSAPIALYGKRVQQWSPWPWD